MIGNHVREMETVADCPRYYQKRVCHRIYDRMKSYKLIIGSMSLTIIRIYDLQFVRIYTK